MFPYCDHRSKLLRAAAIGVLAGSAWFSLSLPATAQDQGVSQQAQRDDASVQADVTSALTQDPALNGQHITATSAQGVVTLVGSVQTDAQRQQAETDAANVSGVSGILNHLTVTNPGAAAPAAGISAQESANQLSQQDQDQNQPANQGQAAPQAQGTVPPPPPDESQPPQQQTYSGPRPPYQPGYAPAPQQTVPYYANTPGPVTVPPGTLLRIRLNQPLDTANIKSGTMFQATAAVDVFENGVLAIPRGALLTGQVVEAKKAGELGGSALLRLQLVNVTLAGRVFPLTTDVWSSKGPNKAGNTVANTVGGSALGAIIGGIIGRGAGAAVGAGVGAVGGLAVSGASGGPRIFLPTEAQVDFHLTNPVTVQPVSWQEAQRLASSAPQPPVLVQRPRPVYVVPGPYPAYPYPYPY